MDTMQSIRRWLVAALAAALVIVLALLILLFAQLRRAQAAEHTLAEATLAALSDAAEDAQALSLAMDKMTIAASEQQQIALMYQTVLSADRVRRSLSALPTDDVRLAPLLRFLASLTDDAGTLLTQLAAGFPTSQDDMAALLRHQPSLRLLHAELGLARDALLRGDDLAQALPPTAITETPNAAELSAYRALPDQKVGSGEALQLAKEFVGVERVTSVAPAPDSLGALPVYGVTVQTADLQLNLEVTQRGGKVLLMSPETAGFPELLSVEECAASAAAFLQSRGFATMTSAWHEVYDGMCVLTFVHEQEGALVWADRAVVQVRMDTGDVVGLEARSYWKNHVPRLVGSPLLSAAEARASLSPQAQEQSARLALLPAGTQERLCWQFTLTHNDDVYISFIDATTGRELLLEKVMQLDDGAIPA